MCGNVIINPAIEQLQDLLCTERVMHENRFFHWLEDRHRNLCPNHTNDIHGKPNTRRK